jgi:hypothetical protein
MSFGIYFWGLIGTYFVILMEIDEIKKKLNWNEKYYWVLLGCFVWPIVLIFYFVEAVQLLREINKKLK